LTQKSNDRLETGQARLIAGVDAQEQQISDLKSATDQVLQEYVSTNQLLDKQGASITKLQDSIEAATAQADSMHAVAITAAQEVAAIKIKTNSLLRLAVDILNVATRGISEVQTVVKLMSRMLEV
jgi:hypothetical protein